MKTYSFYSIIVSLITLLASSCNETSITALPEFYNIHEKLKPNEDYISCKHTYGKDSICGHEITYKVATDSSEVYLNINLTILELHSRITENLLYYIYYVLNNGGFFAVPDTTPHFLTNDFFANSYSQYKIACKTLDWECELFDNSLCRFGSGYWLDIYITPIFLNDNYVTYNKYSEYYFGGAHPNYSSFMQTYDLTTGEAINLEDIIKPDKNDQLRKKVVEHMAVSYPFDSNKTSVKDYLEDLNEWLGTGRSSIDEFNFPLNDPGIHECGLVFSYEKYDLTPGYLGCPHIVVSYDEIRDCLKAPFNDYVTTYSSHAIDTISNELETGRPWYGEHKIDSIRKSMGLSGSGHPYPIKIYNEYIYRHGKPTRHYQIKELIGTWISNGYHNDSKYILSINSDDTYINKTYNAANPNIAEEIEYVLTSKIMGKYTYDKNFNKLTLLNTECEYNIPTDSFIIYDNPEHSEYIIHSIEGDTLILANKTGDLWTYYRSIETD